MRRIIFSEHNFCRELLRQTMIEVREHFTKEEIEGAWVWSDSGKNFEFHGKNGEFFFDLKIADCKWSAQASGWAKMLEQKLGTKFEEEFQPKPETKTNS